VLGRPGPARQCKYWSLARRGSQRHRIDLPQFHPAVANVNQHRCRETRDQVRKVQAAKQALGALAQRHYPAILLTNVVSAHKIDDFLQRFRAERFKAGEEANRSIQLSPLDAT
jgi:hypothetical protein